jgi:hypothetical protein
MLGCIQEEVCSYIISATELFLPTWEQGKQAVALIFFDTAILASSDIGFGVSKKSLFWFDLNLAPRISIKPWDPLV